MIILATFLFLAGVIFFTARYTSLWGHDRVERKYVTELFDKYSGTLSSSMRKTTVEGSCSHVILFGPGYEDCRFSQELYIDKSGDALANIRDIDAKLKQAGLIPEESNSKFFDTYDEYFNKKNPHTYLPELPRPEYDSYYYYDVSDLSYRVPVEGNLREAFVNVTIVSGDELTPDKATGTVSFNKQYADQLKGPARDKYQIRIYLSYSNRY